MPRGITFIKEPPFQILNDTRVSNNIPKHPKENSGKEHHLSRDIHLPDPIIHLMTQKDHVNDIALASAADIVAAGVEQTSAAVAEAATLPEPLLGPGLHL